jgi:hypothetical protein
MVGGYFHGISLRRKERKDFFVATKAQSTKWKLF